MRSGSLIYRRRIGATLVCAAFAVAALLLATAASADPVPPIAVGPIVVANGTLVANVGAGMPANAVVTVDGQPASIDAQGNIVAKVDLTGRSSVTIAVTDPATGTTTSIAIPVDLIGPGGLIPASVFDQLKQGGLTVDVPTDGFAVLPGKSVQVSGSVANKGTLAGLTVDGIDALSLVRSDGTFTVAVPGTNKQVVVSATDRKGVTASSSYRLARLSAMVAATSAQGVKIASVRYITHGVKVRKRVTVTVTVKDNRGLLIRGAKVAVKPAAAQHKLVLGKHAAKRTNNAGRVTFVLRLRAAKFLHGRRLYTVETARTPSAHASRTTSVRVPRLAKHTRR